MTVGTGSDEALVAAAQRGDATAFDALVRRHTTKMYRVAYRILGDSAEAEDAVQEAWVSVWRSLDRFRGESAPTTWLYRVVTNAALASLRRRRPTVPLEPTDDWISDSAALGPEGHALRTEEVARVHRAIATLEPSQRIPLVLRELEGMRYEEIAEMLDVPVTALRSRLHRARVTLLARLKEMRYG
ncbi:RNA polymerase sigma factor [Saccharopolyspora spinosa]|uniref:RNA polymerase sigma-70 factor (ECF subfamily) n=1 Tax=Saccharopolyspora spinosa TaxID=60894 RepID=A0A2N3XXC2_SACSN|nr:sigma-70 family RNA polymerase sigma factor [Saccharopolyspora spinosa]PKW15314.1 RNA polymerase sigma-70 factor (ECF subfamily) [Saccharopolyspora spinosa]